MTDLEFMQQALELASQGRGLVSPNPMVGALIVKSGVVIGRGYHRYANRKHAEICALEEAGAAAKGATLYINLEPCCHYGRTPPCTDALLNSGIYRVVAAMTDPNPKVAGHGFAILSGAGIEVEVGLCEPEARQLNEKFITHISKQRPFVHLKTAMTLDGKIATRTSDARWITGEQAREVSQMLRAEYDAILVGAGTILADDPELTCRIKLKHKRHRALMRVILDGKLRIPLTARVLNDLASNPVLIFAEREAALMLHGEERLDEKMAALTALGAQVIFAPGTDGQIDIATVLAELGQRQLSSLIVEGGAEVSGAFLTAQLIDKVSIFIAPKLIGGRTAIPAIGGIGLEKLAQAVELDQVSLTTHGRDIEVTGYPVFYAIQDQ